MPSGGLVLSGCERFRLVKKPERRNTGWKYVSLPRQMRGFQVGHSSSLDELLTACYGIGERLSVLYSRLFRLRAHRNRLCVRCKHS